MAGWALALLEEFPPPARIGGVLRLVDLEREAASLLLAHLRQELAEIVAKSSILREQDCCLTSRRHCEHMRIIGTPRRSRGNVGHLRLNHFGVNEYAPPALPEVVEQLQDCWVLGQLGEV